MKTLFDKLYPTAVVLGVLGRSAVVILSGNSTTTPWSGGGDMAAYVLLAQNLVSGNGYTYAHIPTAFRMPGYPLFLATMMEIFGQDFALAARFIQVLCGLAAAYFCMQAARVFFGEAAARISLIAALFFPTLVYFSGEILTEGLTSFFLALFLWWFAEDTRRRSWWSAAIVGCTIGLGALFRANMIVLELVALTGAYLSRIGMRTGRQVAIIPVCTALIVVPWLIRNWVVIGHPVFSTESGAAALVSLVNPQARLMAGWDQEIRERIGYVVPNQLETNGPERMLVGSEVAMNHSCWRASWQIWNGMSLAKRINWVFEKWAAYWLSIDQFVEPGQVSRRSRILHRIAVAFYWMLLSLAAVGWWKLKRIESSTAAIFLGYAVLITLLHTPFVMNTRIRTPLMDPLVAVLVGGSWSAQAQVSNKNRNALS